MFSILISALSHELYLPPSKKESGVILIIPIIKGLSKEKSFPFKLKLFLIDKSVVFEIDFIFLEKINYNLEISTTNDYKKIIKSCKDIYLKKSKDYGSAWRILRLPSITDQIFIKAQRIRSIQEKNEKKVNEGIENEFIGIINYCIMAIIQLEINNDEILISSSERKNENNITDLVERYLPKYLFRQKASFELAVTKADINKIKAINNLLQKAELYLRKNDSWFLIIIQRFLLNFSKTIK